MKINLISVRKFKVEAESSVFYLLSAKAFVRFALFSNLSLFYQLLACLQRYFDEVDAFNPKLVSDQRGRGRERGRERREKRKDSGNGLEDPRHSAAMLHSKV